MCDTPYTILMRKLAAADAAGADPLPMTMQERDLLGSIMSSRAWRGLWRWKNKITASETPEHAVEEAQQEFFLYFMEKKLWGRALAAAAAGGECGVRQVLCRAALGVSQEAFRFAVRHGGPETSRAPASWDDLTRPSAQGKRAATETTAAITRQAEPLPMTEEPALWVGKVAAETNEPLTVPPPAEPRPSADEARVALEFLPWDGQPLKAGVAGKDFNKSVWSKHRGVDNDKTGKLLCPATPGIIVAWLRAFGLKNNLSHEEWPEFFTALRRALLLWKPEIVSTGGLLSADATL